MNTLKWFTVRLVIGKNHAGTIFSYDTQVPHYWVFLAAINLCKLFQFCIADRGRKAWGLVFAAAPLKHYRAFVLIHS